MIIFIKNGRTKICSLIKKNLIALGTIFLKLSKDWKQSIKLKHQLVKYGDVDFTITLDVVKANDGFDAEKEKFEKMCHLYGFEKSDYKFKYKSQGEEFEFIGFNPSKPKNNCSIRNVVNGKRYMTNDEGIKNAIKLSKT